MSFRRLPIRVLLVALVSRGSAGLAKGDRRPPPRLRDTGLYSDWDGKVVDPRNIPYSPQYPLWSDGAAKRRWIRIPARRHIDASDPNAWVFPAGTRLWKEFSFGRAVETRYMERLPKGEWLFASYVWNKDGEALLAPEGGILSTAEIRPGLLHAIPSTSDCRACHEGKATPVLGFDVIQLSSDRDPLAANAEPVSAGSADLAKLVSRGLVRGLPDWLLRNAPRISGTPNARAALGYLHGNCANCHNASGPLAELGLDLSYPVSRPAGGREDAPPAARTTASQPSRFKLPGAEGAALPRVSPGRAEASLLYLRMASRHPFAQMPPLGTRIADEEGLARLRLWISEGRPSDRITQPQEVTP
jgi:hypothetical protein